MKSNREKVGGVTLRAVLIGFLFVPVNVYLVVQWESVWGTQYPTTMGIFFNAIFCLLVVTALNLILRKYLPKRALSQAELLTIYVVLITAITVSGHDYTQGLFCSLGDCWMVLNAGKRMECDLRQAYTAMAHCER